MARRKAADDGGGGGGEWLNTYADLITLLFTFFVLLFAMSSVNEAKYNEIAKAFKKEKNWEERLTLDGGKTGGEAAQGGNASGAESSASAGEESAAANEPSSLSEAHDYLLEYINSNNLGDKVMVSQGDGYVFIRFMDEMLFQPNSDSLKPADLEILNFIGYGIKAVQSQAEVIRIDGFTAAVPGNSDYPVSDRKLSSDRANRVLMYFEDVIGIDSTKLIAVSYGKNRPIADNDTEANMAKNRRVEIFISDENRLTAETDMIYEKLLND